MSIDARELATKAAKLISDILEDGGAHIADTKLDIDCDGYPLNIERFPTRWKDTDTVAITIRLRVQRVRSA